jgi:excisionase family DNA binding protein
MLSLSDYFTVADAAEEIGVSQARIRAMIEANQLDAEKVAGRWLINSDSVHSRRNNVRRGGRPFLQRNVWELINNGLIARLFVESDEAARYNVRVQLAGRAEIRDVYVLPRFVQSFEPIVVGHGGRGLAQWAKVSTGNDARWELDSYINSDVLDQPGCRKSISKANGDPNVRLRVVREGEPQLNSDRAYALLVAWLDLADDGDRAAEMVLQSLISELRNKGVEPFPVANSAVGRVSLGVLSALHDELNG